MFVEVILPKTGMAMQDAVISSWLKRQGEAVQKGEPLVEIETEKVVETIEAPATGILEEICFENGQTADVGAKIAVIKVLEEEADTPAPSASPTLESTTAMSAPPPETETVEEKQQPLSLGSTLPISRMRQTISRRMLESLSRTAQLTLFTEADLTATVARRAALLEQRRLTYTDILVFLVARVLEAFPLLNARLEEERIVIPGAVNVGVAVALADGLLVPVVREANRKTLFEISAEIEGLAQGAREGTLSSESLVGATFTITNLGTYGIDFFTPIINLPEVAILGIGRLIEKPVAREGKVQIRPMLGLSLTIDHRLIDGAPAAEFLKAVVAKLEKGEF